MFLFKRSLCAVLCAVLLIFACMPVTARAAEMEDAASCIQQILLYCGHYGKQAETDVLRLMDRLWELDPVQGAVWERLLENWRWVYEEMEITPDCLPDGLNQDDSLCIVVLGYELNDDGSLQPELEGRLEVALRSAEKYPNAFILCTGGETSDIRGLTEAEVMKRWLIDRGIEESRILLEETAMSTTENARHCYEIFQGYPQITQAALVTSQYHIYRSSMMYNAVSIYSSAYNGTRPVEVAGNAVYVSDSEGGEGVYYQAWGLAIVAGLEFENVPAPPLSRLEKITLEGRTEYEPGEFPDFTVTAHYDSGCSREVTASASAAGFDSDVQGQQVLTVTYCENGITAEETVTILLGEEPVPELTGAAEEPEPPIAAALGLIVSFSMILILVVHSLHNKKRQKAKSS